MVQSTMNCWPYSKVNNFGKSIIEILIDIILHIQNRTELDFDYEILLNKDARVPFCFLENLLRKNRY